MQPRPAPEPHVVEVVAFGPVTPGLPGPRRATVRWSNGTVGEALRWYADEVLFSEGDLIGKTPTAIRALHGHRDRDYLTD